MRADPDGGVRFNATLALGGMLSEAATVVPALLHEATNSASGVRGASIMALSSFSNDARLIVPALISALAEKDAGLQETITNALKRLDPEQASKAAVR